MEKVANVDVAGSSMEVTLAMPDGASPFPAVILCHHREGIDAFTIDAASIIKPARNTVTPRRMVASGSQTYHRLAGAVLSSSQLWASVRQRGH